VNPVDWDGEKTSATNNAGTAPSMPPASFAHAKTLLLQAMLQPTCNRTAINNSSRLGMHE
jgi:hypothetical protein